MSFLGGIKKILDGMDESFEAVSGIIPDTLTRMRFKRRKSLSGVYTVPIKLLEGATFPELVAKISYNGDLDTHDIDLLTIPGQTNDVWDQLPNSEKMHVNWEINSYLHKLQKKANADMY